jgi:broad specificity phosphatase PhoE/predicted kinase
MSLGIPITLGSPLAVVMVGLPARGKTYIAQKLARYVSWLGYSARVFNVGNYRRERFGAQVPHSFFDPDNADGMAARHTVAMAALDDLIDWFQAGGHVGIYDATNNSRARRALVRKRLEAAGCQVLFIETICDDEATIESNIRQTKLSAPDYADTDPDEAVADFRARIAHYENSYEPVDEHDVSFVKLIEVDHQVIAQRLKGYVVGRIAHFVMNLHITPRTIWLTRHGQSTANVAGLVGTDMPLTAKGAEYARHLSAFLDERTTGLVGVWTSTLQRSVQTGARLGRPTMALKVLDEIDAGICDGMTYAQIQEQMPGEYARRQSNKLAYRYPRGESYEDIIHRLDPLIIEIERQRDPVMVVAHQAVLRALYGYLSGKDRTEVPHLEIPMHTVLALTPRAYGCEEERFQLEPRLDDGMALDLRPSPTT